MIKMSEELKGEWKLLKVWECHKCRTLIKDGRKVFDHKCDIKENELIADEKIIEDQKRTIEDRDKFIEDQKRTIEDRDKFIEDQKRTIEDRDKFIEDQKRTIEDRDNIIKVQKNIIESQKKAIEDQKKSIENRNKAVENRNKAVENRNKAVEEQKKTIKSRDEVIEYQRKVIEECKRAIKEKIINNNIPKINIEDGNKQIKNNNEQICIDIWRPGCHIKDSKDAGYREDIEIEVFEKGKEKKRVIVKSGKLIKKPDNIDIIGEHTPKGFIIRGIYRNDKILNI